MTARGTLYFLLSMMLTVLVGTAAGLAEAETYNCVYDSSIEWHVDAKQNCRDQIVDPSPNHNDRTFDGWTPQSGTTGDFLDGTCNSPQSSGTWSLARFSPGFSVCNIWSNPAGPATNVVLNLIDTAQGGECPAGQVPNANNLCDDAPPDPNELCSAEYWLEPVWFVQSSSTPPAGEPFMSDSSYGVCPAYYGGGVSICNDSGCFFEAKLFSEDYLTNNPSTWDADDLPPPPSPEPVVTETEEFDAGGNPVPNTKETVTEFNQFDLDENGNPIFEQTTQVDHPDGTSTEYNQSTTYDSATGQPVGSSSSTTSRDANGNVTGSSQTERDAPRSDGTSLDNSASSDCEQPPACEGDTALCSLKAQVFQAMCYGEAEGFDQCDQPPTCKGDPRLCVMAKQQHEFYCSGSDLEGTEAVLADWLGNNGYNPSDLSGNPLEGSNFDYSDLGDQWLNTDLPDAGCPANPSINTMAGAFEIRYDIVCLWLEKISFLIRLAASVAGLGIVMRTITSL